METEYKIVLNDSAFPKTGMVRVTLGMRFKSRTAAILWGFNEFGMGPDALAKWRVMAVKEKSSQNGN